MQTPCMHPACKPHACPSIQSLNAGCHYLLAASRNHGCKPSPRSWLHGTCTRLNPTDLHPIVTFRLHVASNLSYLSKPSSHHQVERQLLNFFPSLFRLLVDRWPQTHAMLLYTLCLYGTPTASSFAPASISAS